METNPLPVTDELLQRGQHVFNINCAPCHGELGDGNGIPNRIGAMAVVANLHDKRIVELADGEIFNTVSYGKGVMQGPLRRRHVHDRGPLGSHRVLRALQLSQLWAGLDECRKRCEAALK